MVSVRAVMKISFMKSSLLSKRRVEGMAMTGLEEIDSTQGIKPMESGRYIQMVLVSGSKLFLKGMSALLKDEVENIKITSLTSYQEIGKYVPKLKPEILLLDNTTLKQEAQKLLSFVVNKSPSTNIILFSPFLIDRINLPNITFLGKDANSSKLINIIKSIGLKHRREN